MWREIRIGVRKTPCRQRIPRILYGWRIVQADTEKHVGAEQCRVRSRTQIEIIPGKIVTHALIGELREAAKMAAVTACEENGCLIERDIVIDAEIRRWNGRLI